MKRAISLILLLLIFLVSCGDITQGTNIDETTNSTQESITENTIEINQDASTHYTVIRPDKADETTLAIIIKFYSELAKKSGFELPFSSDWIKKSDETTEDISQKRELLIGLTNRSESIKLAENLKPLDYIIEVTENKIVIVAGSELALSSAAQYFINTYATQGVISIKDDTTVRGSVSAPKNIVALSDQQNSELRVYDLSLLELGSIEAKIFSFKLPEYNVAGLKLRKSDHFGGEVALACYGASGASIISYPEGKVLWRTYYAADNPHSVELMPNGWFVVASSAGNALRFFNAAKGVTNKYTEVSLTDAHGVLFDPLNNVLWAAGGSILTAYKLSIEGDTLVIKEDESRRFSLPEASAHDLAPYYGDTNFLWVTTSKHVYLYNKSERSLSTRYSGYSFIDKTDVKGIGNFTDGSVVYTFPNNTFKSWNTNILHYGIYDNWSETYIKYALVAPGSAFYKARVWSSDYQ